MYFDACQQKWSNSREILTHFQEVGCIDAYGPIIFSVSQILLGSKSRNNPCSLVVAAVRAFQQKLIPCRIAVKANPLC